MKILFEAIKNGQLVQVIEKRFLFFTWTVERIVRA